MQLISILLRHTQKDSIFYSILVYLPSCWTIMSVVKLCTLSSYCNYMVANKSHKSVTLFHVCLWANIKEHMHFLVVLCKVASEVQSESVVSSAVCCYEVYRDGCYCCTYFSVWLPTARKGGFNLHHWPSGPDPVFVWHCSDNYMKVHTGSLTDCRAPTGDVP